MIERYDQAIATHYSAYRPPLHRIILERVFAGSASFETGLDVGCGTGHSTRALAEYCEHVYGIDPSPSMLNEAVPHERVTYLNGMADNVSLADGSVDVVTFAGSLHYANSDATHEETRRVCRAGSIVVPYDFHILLEEIMPRYGIDLPETISDYDHRTNFSRVPGFVELTVTSERVGVDVTASELTHVVLSDASRFDHFARRYRTLNPFPVLDGELRSRCSGATIEAELFYSKYRIDSLPSRRGLG